MKRVLRFGLYAAVFILGSYLTRVPQIPHVSKGTHSWTTPILGVNDFVSAFIHFLSDHAAWAAYSNQSYVPHMYYSNGGDQGTNVAPGFVGPNVAFTPPTNADQALSCFETYQLWTNNTGNSTPAWNTHMWLAGIGTTNSETDTGCPLWPYIGDHIFGPGASPSSGIPAFAPALSYGVAVESRVDAIVSNGTYGCGGGTAVSTISTSGTCPGSGCTEILHGSYPQNSCRAGTVNIPGSSVDCAAVNDYIQVTNSSVSADNSAPGQTFKVTAVSAGSGTISFINSNAASCGSSCGNVSFPYVEGSPPYAMPLGNDGANYAGATAAFLYDSGGSGNVSYSMLMHTMCGPLLACPYFSGCGLWTNSGPNGSFGGTTAAFQ